MAARPRSVGGCGCCNWRAIIYRMKEGLLDTTKELETPSGVDEEIWSRYVKQARDSNGFDLDEQNIPEGTPYAALTVVKFEMKEEDLIYKNLCIISTKALEWLVNKNNVKEFEFVDVVKANVLQGGAGIMYSYFITFNAKKNCSTSTGEEQMQMKEFQAEIECRLRIDQDNDLFDKYPPKVKFCRMKPT